MGVDFSTGKFSELKKRIDIAMSRGSDEFLNDKARNFCWNALSADAHWQVNKHFARMTNISAAILLADFISKDKYFHNTTKNYDHWFYNTRETIENDTTLTPREQRPVLELLKRLEIVKVKQKGIPRQNFYYLDYERIQSVFNLES